MGKKRNTAKTGDKGLYKNRPQDEVVRPNRNADKDDNMHNEIDRYHNEKDEEFLKLNQESDEEVENDGYTDKEAIMDLAGGASSSSEDEDDSDEAEKGLQEAHGSDDSEEVDLSSDDDDDDDDLEMDEEAVTDWGRKKSAYFGGDTADLEIGQNEEDAYLEEEAAKQVQAARYEQMDEEDFVLSDNEQDESKTETVQTARDLKKLSKAAKRKMLQSHHPELYPLITHFSHVVQDWEDRTRVAAGALLESKNVSPEDVGATGKGLEYILTKSLIQSSTALNVATYLLLKAEKAAEEKEDMDEDDAIKSHPVMTRLQQLNKLSMKLEDNVESKIPTLTEQVDSLVKAAALMQDEADESIDDSDSAESGKDDDEDADSQSGSTPASPDSDDDDDDDHDNMDEEEEKEAIARGVLNNARFGLRPQEVSGKTKSSSRQRRAVPDFGDEELTEARSRQASRSLASTINAIQQRSATKSRKTKRLDEDLDQQEDDAMRRGLKMMEDELGPLDSDDDGDDDNDDDVIDDELDDGLGGGDDGFYEKVKKKSLAKKEFKKQLYAVAPKYPGMEAEVDGERAISKMIMKNRGLVPHKARINRNPRVKKREQYRKALIKRKGAVREVRTNEGHKYGGEETGIKTGLVRGRKLNS